MKNKKPEPFLWVPGKGHSNEAMSRIRDHFPLPKLAMGEAWFMGEKRKMFDELLNGVDGISSYDLRKPLEEILSGTSSFGSMPEWVDWYHYLLGQLVPRSHDYYLESLLEYLIGGFFTQYPETISEPYVGFREDALATLGQCMMDADRWHDGKIIVGRLLHRDNDNPNEIWLWDKASGDFSSSAFFCIKYLKPEQIQPWLESVLNIDCAHWNAQLMVWLLGAHDMLTGKITEACDLDCSGRPDVSWAYSHCLKGNYTGDYSENTPRAPDFLPSENREEILRVLDETLSEELLFKWLDSIKAYDYLESELAELPSRFAEVYLS